MNHEVEKSFDEFRDVIASLPLSAVIDRALLDNDEFTLASEGNLSIIYAPFDYINREAKVALVGVTPGWTQMHTSFVEARFGIEQGQSTNDILRRVKRVAAFSGSLRTNLVSMLDDIGLPEALAVTSTSDLFDEKSEHLLHSTSAVRYPVFKAGKNYTGSAPHLADAPLFAPYLDLLATELSQLDRAIVVPLGKAVQTSLRHLVDHDAIAEARCLFGFPHPSGANARRVPQMDANRQNLVDAVASWFDS